MKERRVILFLTATTVTFAVMAQGFRLEIFGREISGNFGNILDTVNQVLHPNPMGLPSLQSLATEVARNPDIVATILNRPQNLAYLPVVNAIIDGRNAVLQSGGHRIPPKVRQALSGVYDGALLDSVRWSTDWSLVQNTLQAVQMWANKDTRAIALMNVVIFRDADAVDDIENWAHELYHVKQYRDWGVSRFAEEWVKNSSEGGSVESPAYERASAVWDSLKGSWEIENGAIKTDFACFTPNSSTAYCNLYVGTDYEYVTFTVTGEAYATSDGSGKGRMQLLLMANGQVCNSDTGEKGVENATRLSGGGYQCRIRVYGGQTRRVTLVAPNSRATATYTRATVSR